MVDDRLEVAVGEPAGLGRQTEGPLDLIRSDERGELGGSADLRPDPLGPCRRGEDQPALRSGSELEEGGLVWTGWPGAWMERVSRPLGIVGRIDAGVARRRQPVPGGRTP